MAIKVTKRDVVEVLRAKYYSLFYNIGSSCRFGKIKFWESDRQGINIGNRVVIFRNTEIQGKEDKPVTIENNVFINQGCLIRANVTIGKNTSIGQGVSIISDNHEIGPKEKRAGSPYFSQIVIGEGCWIGANSTILSGVKVGNGTIIAAGSVVNRDCEPNSLYGGVPASKIKSLDLLQATI